MAKAVITVELPQSHTFKSMRLTWAAAGATDEHSGWQTPARRTTRDKRRAAQHAAAGTGPFDFAQGLVCRRLRAADRDQRGVADTSGGVGGQALAQRSG